VGNDHAGTYFSVVLAILPGIEGVLRSGQVWSQHAALEVLIELCGSFKPEHGQEIYNGLPLSVLLKQGARELAPLVRALTAGNTQTAESAKQLLGIFRR
jgi:hypothetical protein